MARTLKAFHRFSAPLYVRLICRSLGGSKRFTAALFLVTLALMSSNPMTAQRRGQPPEAIDAFRFRFVGPQAGNRIAAVAGVPGDINTYYAGGASGGIFQYID